MATTENPAQQHTNFMDSGQLRFSDPFYKGSFRDPAALSDEDYHKRRDIMRRGATINPDFFKQGIDKNFWGTPGVRQSYGQLMDQTSQWANESGGIGTALRGMEGQMTGQNSVVDASAKAEAERTRQGIAQQAMMGARGGMSPAMQRQAMMQQSQVGAQMASQVAAAKAQERQQAQMAYFQARAAQMGQIGQGAEFARGTAGGLQDMNAARWAQYQEAVG